MAKEHFTARLTEEHIRAIFAAQKVYGGSRADALATVMAVGVQAVLKKMSVGCIMKTASGLTSIESADITTEDLFVTYWQYADALLFEGKGSYYIADVPVGGYWEAKGLTGRVVLHRSMGLTPDGITNSMREQELCPVVPKWLEEEE